MRTEQYKECTIVAWEQDKEIFCHLYRPMAKIKMISVNECSDGSRITSVNQAVNQAKLIVDVCEKHGWS